MPLGSVGGHFWCLWESIGPPGGVDADKGSGAEFLGGTFGCLGLSGGALWATCGSLLVSFGRFCCVFFSYSSLFFFVPIFGSVSDHKREVLKGQRPLNL